MASVLSIPDLSHIIQLAVAPVFLLAGIAGFLNVMTGRLGRIVDRSRVLEERLDDCLEEKMAERAEAELKLLQRRMGLNNWSIGFCILSGLLICLLVTTLFVGGYWGINIRAGIVLFFVLAMMSLIVALVLFLKETHLAIRTLRQHREHRS